MLIGLKQPDINEPAESHLSSLCCLTSKETQFNFFLPNYTHRNVFIQFCNIFIQVTKFGFESLALLSATAAKNDEEPSENMPSGYFIRHNLPIKQKQEVDCEDPKVVEVYVCTCECVFRGSLRSFEVRLLRKADREFGTFDPGLCLGQKVVLPVQHPHTNTHTHTLQGLCCVVYFWIMSVV